MLNFYMLPPRDLQLYTSGVDTVLILFEGIDGSGKTTIANAFAGSLVEREYDYHRFAFPSKRPVGALVRQAFRGEIFLAATAYQHLMAADALDHEEDIRQAVKDYDVVILDRHPTVSGLVYQTETYGVETVMQVNTPHLFTSPDLVVLVDVPAEVALARTQARDITDVYEQASLSTVSLRRSRYMACMTMLPYRYMIVDGTADVNKSVDKVSEFVSRLLKRSN